MKNISMPVPKVDQEGRPIPGRFETLNAQINTVAGRQRRPAIIQDYENLFIAKERRERRRLGQLRGAGFDPFYMKIGAAYLALDDGQIAIAEEILDSLLPIDDAADDGADKRAAHFKLFVAIRDETKARAEALGGPSEGQKLIDDLAAVDTQDDSAPISPDAAEGGDVGAGQI